MTTRTQLSASPGLACASALGWLLAITVTAGGPWRSLAEEPTGEPLVLDERPAPLTPQTARSEADEDRLQAQACFAHSQILLARGERAQALHRLERAWRYDPAAPQLLDNIVTLAADLGYAEEAARYAVLSAERQPMDLRVLAQLAALLVAANDLPRAARMYDRAVQALPNTRSRDHVVLHLELGRLHFVMENFGKSAESYAVVQEALARPDSFGLTEAALTELLRDPPLVYALMGEAFLGANRPDAANQAFQQAHAVSGDDAVWAYQQARVAAQQQRWTDATAQLDAYFAMKSAAADERPYLLLAEILRATTADTREATARLGARLTTLHTQDPTNVPLGYSLARALVDTGQLEPASQLYRELLERQPVSAAFAGLARIQRSQRQVPELLDILGRAADRAHNLGVLGRELDPLLADTATIQALAEHCRSKTATALDVAARRECYGLALLLLAGQQYDLAATFYTPAFQEADESLRTRRMEVIAMQLYAAEQGDRAANVLRSLLQANPTKEKAASYSYYLAGTVEMAGNTREALQLAVAAAAESPTFLQLQLRPAWVLYHARQFDQAEPRYRELLARWKDDHETPGIRDLVRQIRLSLSNICAERNRFDEAEELLEEVLDEFPEDAAAQNDLGYLWADRGAHLQRSLAMTRHAVASQPGNPAYRDSLGWTYYRLGRYDEAVQELEQAVSDSDPDGVLLDHLGDAFWQTKQHERARDAWRRAADAFRGNRESQRLERMEEKLQQHAAP